MEAYAALDATRLPRWSAGSDSPQWWGASVLIAILATVYATLIASWFYLRMGANKWPPAELGMPMIFWPTVGTGIRLASEPLMLWASKAAARGQRTALAVPLGGAIILMIGWMVLIIESYFHLPYDWTFGTYGSIEWSMTTFAFLNAFVAVIWGIALWIRALEGYITPERRVGLQMLKMYWTFNFIAWVFLWLVIYYGPRVFHKP